MEPREVDGQEPTASGRGGVRRGDVFISPTRRSLSHTAGAQGGQRGRRARRDAPGVTEDMLARLMAADFAAMSARSPPSPNCWAAPTRRG